MVNREDTCEFLGQIIDVFEDFLDARGIQNPKLRNVDPRENVANIVDEDYDDLRNNLARLMVNWGVIHQD